jgi:hypothetical protein
MRRTATYRELRSFLPQLQPAWWVLRGYLVALMLGAASSSYPHALSPLPRMWDSRLLGLLVTLGSIVASVAWSRVTPARRGGLRALTVAGNIAVVVAALTFVDNGPGYQQVRYVDKQQEPGFPPVVRGPYGNILNIYPYAADGTPLSGVLLYDQAGNPIPGVVMDEYSVLHGYRDSTGQLVPNMFPYPEPIRDPNTGQVIGERQRPVIVAPPLLPSSPAASVAPSVGPTAEQSAAPPAAATPTASPATPAPPGSASPSASATPQPAPSPASGTAKPSPASSSTTR